MRTLVKPERYTRKAYRKFVKDCTEAGLRPYHYHGRNYYEGPAVDVYPDKPHFPKTVPCQQDAMGKGRVYYPTGRMR